MDNELSESIDLEHLLNVETCFHCPQAFVSLGFHCRRDIFLETSMFVIGKNPEVLQMVQGA